MRIGIVDVDGHHFPNLPLMKKPFCVDKYDDDGFMIENSVVVIDEGKIYELDDSDHTIIGGEVHLDSIDDGSWLEITKGTLEECFEKLN